MTPSERPQFSIVIPARNEERNLPKCLAAIREAQRLTHGEVEVIVVANRCTDKTEEVARQLGCTVISDDSKNLSRIRNRGVAASHAEWVVTIDADSIMSPGMLAEVRRLLQTATVIGGGVVMLPERWSLGIFLTGLCLAPIALWYGISGGLFFCRRRDFDAIGGFDESLASVEDIDFAKRLRRYGRKNGRRFTTIWRAWIVTSCRKFDHFGDWYFLKNPRLSLTLLKGRDQKAADSVWYDFERRE